MRLQTKCMIKYLTSFSLFRETWTTNVAIQDIVALILNLLIQFSNSLPIRSPNTIAKYYQIWTLNLVFKNSIQKNSKI